MGRMPSVGGGIKGWGVVSCGTGLINCVRSYKAIRMCLECVFGEGERETKRERDGNNFLLYQFNAYLKCDQRFYPPGVGGVKTI